MFIDFTYIYHCWS